MTDHKTLAKLFEAALKEPDPAPTNRPRNVLPPRTSVQGKPSQNGNAAGQRGINNPPQSR